MGAGTYQDALRPLLLAPCPLASPPSSLRHPPPHLLHPAPPPPPQGIFIGLILKESELKDQIEAGGMDGAYVRAGLQRAPPPACRPSRPACRAPPAPAHHQTYPFTYPCCPPPRPRPPKTYFASDGTSEASKPGNWKSMAKKAAEMGKLFIPSVGPG
jgi:hypothetical protein